MRDFATGMIFTSLSLFALAFAAWHASIAGVFLAATCLSVALFVLLATGVARAALAGSLWLALFLATGLVLLELASDWGAPGVGKLLAGAAYLFAVWLVTPLLSRLDYGRLLRR